jgi:hypothetical protein
VKPQHFLLLLRPAVVPCEELMEGDNGAIISIEPRPIIIGSVATFTCDENFELVGEATRQCTVDGWSGANNPRCSEYTAPTAISANQVTSPIADCVHV